MAVFEFCHINDYMILLAFGTYIIKIKLLTVKALIEIAEFYFRLCFFCCFLVFLSQSWVGCTSVDLFRKFEHTDFYHQNISNDNQR